MSTIIAELPNIAMLAHDAKGDVAMGQSENTTVLIVKTPNPNSVEKAPRHKAQGCVKKATFLPSQSQVYKCYVHKT